MKGKKQTRYGMKRVLRSLLKSGENAKRKYNSSS